MLLKNFSDFCISSRLRRNFLYHLPTAMIPLACRTMVFMLLISVLSAVFRLTTLRRLRIGLPVFPLQAHYLVFVPSKPGKSQEGLLILYYNDLPMKRYYKDNNS